MGNAKKRERIRKGIVEKKKREETEKETGGSKDACIFGQNGSNISSSGAPKMSYYGGNKMLRVAK